MRYVVNPKIENKTQMFYNKNNQLYYYALKQSSGRYDFYGLGSSVTKLDSEVVFELHLPKYGECLQTLDGTPCCIKEFSLEEQLREFVNEECYISVRIVKNGELYLINNGYLHYNKNKDIFSLRGGTLSFHNHQVERIDKNVIFLKGL